MLPMFTAAFSIPFCITAVTDGGPATLAGTCACLRNRAVDNRQMAVFAASDSDAGGGRDSVDDPIDNAGVGGAAASAGIVGR